MARSRAGWHADGGRLRPGVAFVADFVGRINARCRRRWRRTAACASARAASTAARRHAGSAAKVYLRLEDVPARLVAAGDSNVFEAQIDKIEFLGSYCLVRVRADDLGEHRLTVYLSLNFLAEQQLEVGRPVADAAAARAYEAVLN